MNISIKYLLILACLCLSLKANVLWAEEKKSASMKGYTQFGTAELVGRLEDSRLVECSGMDVSMAFDNLLWAINDSDRGPYIYALGLDGRNRGRVLVAGAINRDWEGLDTFLWQDRPMILIADFGDNNEKYDTHTLYIVEEPPLLDESYDESKTIEVAWRIVFSYPDRNHDAEGVAVDTINEKVLILTKRDTPPLLYELPLKPTSESLPVVAHKVTEVNRITPPSSEDLIQKYGIYLSQPTALDLSSDGHQAVVLTYEHAYLFNRGHQDSWASAFNNRPLIVHLPPPQDRSDFRQREAICFVPKRKGLLVTSEGIRAGIFLLEGR